MFKVGFTNFSNIMAIQVSLPGRKKIRRNVRSRNFPRINLKTSMKNCETVQSSKTLIKLLANYVYLTQRR